MTEAEWCASGIAADVFHVLELSMLEEKKKANRTKGR